MSVELNDKEISRLLSADAQSCTYYRTKSLNDKLYLHCKGYSKLQALEGFVGLKALYGETNAFSQIEGLEELKELRALYLQENCIKVIEGLENLPLLSSLNLASNYITKIENLETNTELRTLLLAGNKIGVNGVEDLEGLLCLDQLSVLDIAHNQVSDPEAVEVFSKMPQLKVLYLKGNPVVSSIPYYRKTLIHKLPNLTYLDDRPVFGEEKRSVEAFFRGGVEEERAERKRIVDEKREQHRQQQMQFRRMVSSSSSSGTGTFYESDTPATVASDRGTETEVDDDVSSVSGHSTTSTLGNDAR